MKIVDTNAKKALKQMKMEIAVDYEMGQGDIFDMLENAYSSGILESYFRTLEQKKSNLSNIYNPFE